jgi:5-methylcytosine-specific restriction endonuclease McrA
MRRNPVKKPVDTNKKFNRKASHFKERFPGLELNFIKMVMSKFIGYKCRYCHEELTLDNCSADHRVSTKNGGKNTEDNFAIICKKCNRGKSDFNEDFFLELLKTADKYGQRKSLLGKLAQATTIFGRWK